MKALHMVRNNLTHQYMLVDCWLENSFAEKPFFNGSSNFINCTPLLESQHGGMQAVKENLGVCQR